MPSQIGVDSIVQRSRDPRDDRGCGAPLDAADIDEPTAVAGGQEKRAGAGAGERHVEADDDEAPLPPDLHLPPAARDAADVWARLVLRHEPFQPPRFTWSQTSKPSRSRRRAAARSDCR